MTLTSSCSFFQISRKTCFCLKFQIFLRKPLNFSYFLHSEIEIELVVEIFYSTHFAFTSKDDAKVFVDLYWQPFSQKSVIRFDVELYNFSSSHNILYNVENLLFELIRLTFFKIDSHQQGTQYYVFLFKERRKRRVWSKKKAAIFFHNLSISKKFDSVLTLKIM